MTNIIHKAEYFILRISGILIITLLWELLPMLHVLDEKYLPRFSTVVLTLIKMFLEKNLFMHLSVSLWRVLCGLLLAAFWGIILGLLLAIFSPRIVDALNPLLRILSQVNPFSLIPVFILFFGIGEAAKLAVITWACLWPVLFNTITGIKTINPILIKTAKSMNTGFFRMIFNILLPASSPSIFLGLRLGGQMSFYMLVAGEMLGANAGLGLMLHKSGHLFDAPSLYAVSLCIVGLGVGINRFFLFLEEGIFYWKEEVDIFGNPVVKEKSIRLGKAELALIAILLAGVLFIGTQQVTIANEIGQNPMQHQHK